MVSLIKVYDILLKEYGAQGWWPTILFFPEERTAYTNHISSQRFQEKDTVLKRNDLQKQPILIYHPGDYSYPKTDKQRLEIAIGAILAQNTSWNNAQKAVVNLNRNELVDIQNLLRVDIKELEDIIRSAGFFRQKAERLKILADFISKTGFDFTREELLELKGIGPETADSILLYACQKPEFVVDAYTKRIFFRLGLIGDLNYEKTKDFFEDNLPKNVDIYQEYHALIVEHAKKFCRKKPECEGCPLLDICGHGKLNICKTN